MCFFEFISYNFKKKSKMRKKNILAFISILLVVSQWLFVSCVRDEDYITDSSVVLKFSQDTVSFDTIFTTVGSVTKRVTVYNKESDAVKINSITLGGGANSYYRINVDGNPNLVAKNIEIPAKDSISIFVRVELDVNNQNNPLLVQDSIILSFNNKQQYIQLLAYGQDAYYHKPSKHTFNIGGENVDINCSLANEESSPLGSGVEISGTDITWKTDKPHVIVGTCVVSGGYTLKLQDGNKIYVSNGGDLTVLNGSSLHSTGSVNEPVVFNSIRTQGRYSDIAGQWSGVYLSAGSKNNIINYTTIKNATIGLTVDTCVTQAINDNSFTAPTLKIENSKIENCSLIGLYARGAVVEGYNLIIQNTGSYTVGLAMGGNYRFVYCTFANYWSSNSTRNDAVLVLNDWYEASGGAKIIRTLYNAEFYNCVIYGNSAKDEVEFDLQETENINYKFDHCLIKTSAFNNSKSFSKDCIFNIDPLFKDPYSNDVTPMENSPLIANADANWNYIVYTDIFNNYRGSYPTIGAIEYVATNNYLARKRR